MCDFNMGYCGIGCEGRSFSDLRDVNGILRLVLSSGAQPAHLPLFTSLLISLFTSLLISLFTSLLISLFIALFTSLLISHFLCLTEDTKLNRFI